MSDAITRIEVTFMLPVELTSAEERAIGKIVDDAARRSAPPGMVHWLSGVGSKPNLSQADQQFLGRPVDPNAPPSGEPSFDHSVLCFETFARETYEDEPPTSPGAESR